MGNLLSVFEAVEPQVAVAQLEHQVVSLPDLFGGGLDREPGICEAWLEEGCFRCIAGWAGVCNPELGEGGLPGASYG